MSWARVGMKVVCIDAAEKPPLSDRIEYYGGMDGLSEGSIYTIREAFLDFYENVTMVRLNEIWRPQGPEDTSGMESGYRLERFRPLVTKTIEEDVQTFKRIADKAPNLEDVE